MLALHKPSHWQVVLFSFFLATGSAAFAAEQPDTAKVQQLLVELGYDISEVDGELGSETRNAIELFQQDYELPETGRLNEKTLAELEASHRKMTRRRKQKPAESDYAFYSSTKAAEAEEPSSDSAELADDEAFEAEESEPEVVEEDFDDDDYQQEDGFGTEPEREFSLLAVTQEQLDELGYEPGNFEGDMTDETREALKKFQEDNDIPMTGEADAATNNALNREMKQLKRDQIAEQKAAGKEPIAADTLPSEPAGPITGSRLASGYFAFEIIPSEFEADNGFTIDSQFGIALEALLPAGNRDDNVFFKFSGELNALDDDRDAGNNTQVSTSFSYTLFGVDVGTTVPLATTANAEFDAYGMIGGGVIASLSDVSIDNGPNFFEEDEFDFSIGVRAAGGVRTLINQKLELGAEFGLNKIGAFDGTQISLTAGLRATERLGFYYTNRTSEIDDDFLQGDLKYHRLALRLLLE